MTIRISIGLATGTKRVNTYQSRLDLTTLVDIGLVDSILLADRRCSSLTRTHVNGKSNSNGKGDLTYHGDENIERKKQVYADISRQWIVLL